MIEWIVTAPFIVLGWIIIGAIAGDLARRFMGRPDRSGCLDFVLGIAGAIIGGFLASIIGVNTPDGGIALVIVNLIIATIGAAVLIFIGSLFTGRGRART
ncbi:GlsB/YeaQ/YmgE family stress response membrane protein [Phototrophicus methaneseepsis]|uniref:GlsB/YeaQ/YmgE family stress response membrane protein n=2 Tax=Phototrophicus methaneseepsis TaxID=2710758 RepID=A0A7S8EE24_9CHLR|nr:GlsB/YeaQ/YmgE family stress response membrane protein [Phototrophicus methaneseepsis]